MTEPTDRSQDHASLDHPSQDENPNDPQDLIERIGHPKGALAVLALYMLLFVVGWVGLYFFLFLSRGATSF